jgi:hypothetical protein
MATSKKVTELAALSAASASDLLLVVHNPASDAVSQKITVSDFFGNVAANVVLGGTFALSNTAAPTTSLSTGKVGEIRYDSNYIYVCVATNTWKRSAISSW